MDFPTMFTKNTKEYSSEPGAPYLQDYEYALDDEGHKVLVKADSTTDVYGRIQADRDSCDINVLMQRFALGDTEALNIKKGMFIDTRNMPTTLAEVFQMGIECEQYFEGLPTDLKEMFDNSHSVFFSEMNDDPKSFENKVNAYNDRFVNHQFDIDDHADDETPKENNYHE